MNKQNRNMFAITVASIFFLASVVLCPITVSAWGDNSEGGRPSYTEKEIKEGILDNQIIFNAISDGKIGDEKNFVGTRECTVLPDGRADSATKDTVWNGNNIDVEDGKTYVIRLYVRNDNPNGEDATAEDTRVSFSIPNEYDAENGRIQVNGFIYSSNASPSEYWDYVNFNSDIPFQLDYIYGSALLSNNKAKDEAVAGGYPDRAGWPLSDDIVKAASINGVLIGSNDLDGHVLGGSQYDNCVTIMVKAVFGTNFTVEQKVRLAGGSKEDWADTVDAKVGDKVEFRILYTNTSSEEQQNVAIKDILPENLEYVAGSSVIKNSNHPDGTKIDQDSLVENGIRIGSYGAGVNAYIYFTAEVVDEDLEQGLNVLTNWSQAGVGDVTIQDSAEVRIQNDAKYHIILTVHIVVILICFIVLVITICKAIKRHKIIRRK